MSGRERVVEVVVHTNGVDENGEFGHAPAEHERGDGKLVLEASTGRKDEVSAASRSKKQVAHPMRTKPATKKGIAM